MMKDNKLYYVAILTVLLALGFLATTFISYFVARDSLSRQITEEALPLTSDNIYSEIQRDLLTPVLISSLMARDTFVRDWVLDGERDPARIRSYLREIQHRYDTVTAFFVSERTHHYYHLNGMLKTVHDTDPADSWYFRVRDDLKAPYEINVDVDTADRKRMSIFINYRVVDSKGNFLGVTGVGLSVDSVTKLIESYQRRYGRTIYFLDREGRVTLHGSAFSGSDNIHEMPGLKQRAVYILANPSASVSYERADGRTVFVNSRLVPEFDWYLLVEQDAGINATRIHTTLIVNIVVSLAVTALVLLAAYLTLNGYQRRLEEMATTDKLTGAANRQVFDIVFDHINRTIKRQPRPVCVILLDIDHFKRVNDTYGHPGGDVVIQRIVAVIRQHVRDGDTVCRWGGEEFLILLDDCPVTRAVTSAENIRNTIKAQSVLYGRDKISVTASCGVAQLRPGENAESLVNRADAALYAAKRAGRDQVHKDADD